MYTFFFILYVRTLMHSGFESDF